MNSTTSLEQEQAQNMSSLSYGLGLSLGVLFLILLLTYASYLCNRSPLPPPTTARTNTTTTKHGLDEDILCHYPTILYCHSESSSVSSSGCSICLADYKDSDVLRLLPECGHVFHCRCIDPWLRVHPTCPICRNSPVPTPVQTPPAGVITVV
ncbi:RING-H2 finger protein [Actinidia chinensis var. chinensis]|uniref:RING-H2 finger protein n=1 Tax=Actinidia chinensis var. chinensis TaxID=1590841 RepID=A0A2R6PYJ2_ACTCC|nr:RING-H2 finger protein [Actinidia chinensis var. chinensis]